MFLNYPNVKLLICLVLLVWNVIVCVGQIQLETFQPLGQAYIAPYPDNIVFADLDGDEDQDLIFIPKRQPVVVWLENNGNGSFIETHLLKLEECDYNALHVKDFEGDGDKDLLIKTKNTITLFRNRGNGNFLNAEKLFEIETASLKARFLQVDDFDKDGELEFFFKDNEKKRLFYLKQNNSGEYIKHSFFIDDHLPISTIEFKDLDGDGLKDIIAGSKGKYFWFKQYFTKTFSELQVICEDATNGIFIDDIDQDGKPDIIAFLAEATSWYRQEDDGTFLEKFVGKYVYESSGTFAVGDIDGDGQKDIIRHSRSEGVFLFQKKNKRKFKEGKKIYKFPYYHYHKNCKLFVVDIDADGVQDIVAKLDSKLVKLDFTKKEQVPQVLLDWPNESLYQLKDVTGDGYKDMLCIDEEEPNIYWYPNGKRGFGERQILLKTEFPILNYEAADIDNDNDLDLIVCLPFSMNEDGTRNFSKELICYINDGFNDFSESYTIFLQPKSLRSNKIVRHYNLSYFLLADMNKDHYLDILFFSRMDSYFNKDRPTNLFLNLLENNKGKGFSEPQAIKQINQVGAGKFLKSKFSEKAYIYLEIAGQSQILLLEGNEKKRLISSKKLDLLFTPKYPTSLGLSDVNNDGYEEVISNPKRHSVDDLVTTLSMAKNRTDEKFEPFTDIFEVNRWANFDLIDLDGDGDLDILNRPYPTASPYQPTTYCIYSNDGATNFSKQGCYDSKGWYSLKYHEDVNNDQRKEIITTKNGVIGIIPVKP